MAKPTYEDLRRTSEALYAYDRAHELNWLRPYIPFRASNVRTAYLADSGCWSENVEAIRAHVLRAGFLCPKCDDYCCKCHGEGWTDDDVDTDCGPVATYAECGCQVCALEAP